MSIVHWKEELLSLDFWNVRSTCNALCSYSLSVVLLHSLYRVSLLPQSRSPRHRHHVPAPPNHPPPQHHRPPVDPPVPATCVERAYWWAPTPKTSNLEHQCPLISLKFGRSRRRKPGWREIWMRSGFKSPRWVIAFQKKKLTGHKKCRRKSLRCRRIWGLEIPRDCKTLELHLDADVSVLSSPFRSDGRVDRRGFSSSLIWTT
jgi:hypothetical protein